MEVEHDLKGEVLGLGVLDRGLGQPVIEGSSKGNVRMEFPS